MSFSLVNNLASLDSQSRLSATSAKLNRTLQRLSSGLRINNSGDDAAGLAIANGFRNEIAKLNQGIRNANDGVSTLQIIDGGLATISTLLDRATVLATQAASDTFTGSRGTLQAELNKVLAEIDRQAQNIGLGGANGTPEGRYNRSISVFIGGGTTATSTNNTVTVDLSNSRVDTSANGLNLVNLYITDNAISSGAFAGAAGAFTVTLNGTNYTVTLTGGETAAATATLLNAVSGFNAAGLQATADASGRLIITSANGGFTISGAGAGAMAGTYNNGASSATSALSAIKSAINLLGQVQGKVGAGQNNLSQAIDLATSQLTNFQAAESRIRDADIAAEASDLSRLTILQQAGVAALAQANQSNQAVLSLLR
jgi:flagellin